VSRLLGVGHTHLDDGTLLYHVAEGRRLSVHPGSRRDVWAPATSTIHKELGNQSGGEDFVLRFVPKQRYDVRHGHRYKRLDRTGHLQRALVRFFSEKTPDKCPAAEERDFAERSRRRRHGRALRRVGRQHHAEVGAISDIAYRSFDSRCEVQGDWQGDFARVVGSRSAADEGDRRRTGAQGGVECGAKCWESLDVDPRWVSANIQPECEAVEKRTRSVRVSGVQFRGAKKECLSRGWDVPLGGNAFGELLLQRGHLLLFLSNFGFNRWLFLRPSVPEFKLQVVDVCLHPVNFVLDALACCRDGAWEPDEGNGAWEPGEGSGSATLR
jgi:hypothetical protein